MADIRLITLDPGHFHAALVQKEMYPGVARKTHVYAPLGPDLVAHVQRVAGFNARPDHPTNWELEVHAGPDYLERMLAEKQGNVVVLAGRNRQKIDYIQAAVNAGLHVLADKPWIIEADQLVKLAAILDEAERRGIVAYDIMTERHEITSILQRELVNDRDTFGTILPGSEESPAVFMESVHYLCKEVAGVPLRRPSWFFDIQEQGEGLTDVGTHLVDLAAWILFPEQAIDAGNDIRLLTARRWPTELTRGQFAQVTDAADFPDMLSPAIERGRLAYFCNNVVSYTLRGIHVQLNILWDFQADAGAGDTHLAGFRSSRSSTEIRQGKEENYRPELYVIPNEPSMKAAVYAALAKKVAGLQGPYPGLTVEDLGERLVVRIPDNYRVGHEAHFAEVTRQFLHYVEDRRALPAWEKPNMLAKYFVTTRGVAQSR
jgi:predicted dehydrogenase